MPHVIQLPDALSLPVIQGSPRGRRPRNIVDLQAVRSARRVEQIIAEQKLDQLREKLGYHRAGVEGTLAEIQALQNQMKRLP